MLQRKERGDDRMNSSQEQPPTPDEIDALARAARDGDADALEDLIRVLRPRVLAICRGVLPFNPDAEDACQEALINIAAKIGSFRGTSRFTTWVHAVAVNSARSTYRRLKNQARPTDDVFLERPDPRTTSVIAGTRLDLLEAMDILERDHPNFVTPLLLRDVYGLSYNEIAAETGAPLGTVKSQVHDGRRLVRPLLRVTE
jgi:RNA polymerase sigma-70 factor, ECF subfamily